MIPGMPHTFEPHPTGYTCTVCGGTAGTQQDTTHRWTAPEATAPQPDPQAATSTNQPTAVAEDSLNDLRRRLAQIAPTKRTGSRNLRDEFDTTRRITIDA